MWGCSVLLGVLQVLVLLLLLLEKHRRYLGLQDPDFSMLEVRAASSTVPWVNDSSSLMREYNVWVLRWGSTGLLGLSGRTPGWRALLASSQLGKL